eukprot:11894-Heterococcus_DN1.PRE.1
MILRRIFIEAQKETSSLEYNVNNAVQTGFIDVRVRGQLMVSGLNTSMTCTGDTAVYNTVEVIDEFDANAKVYRLAMNSVLCTALCASLVLRRIFVEAQEDTSALEYDIYKAVQNAVVNAHVVRWSVAMHMLAL